MIFQAMLSGKASDEQACSLEAQRSKAATKFETRNPKLETRNSKPEARNKFKCSKY